MHRTAIQSSAASSSGSSYPTIPSDYFGDGNDQSRYSNDDTVTTFSSSDIRHNNRVQRELHRAIRDSIVAERILDRQARKKYPLTQEEKEEQRLAKRQWELSNATLKKIAGEQEALLQLVAKQRISEMSEKKRMEMHPRMQQALAETITKKTERGGLVQQVFNENTPDIGDFIQQQEDALQTVRRKLRHQQPPAEAWEWEQPRQQHHYHLQRQQQQQQQQQQVQQPRSRDRVGAYVAAGRHQQYPRQNQKVEPNEADLAAFVRLQDREYRAAQRRTYEQRQQDREYRQQHNQSPAMSFPSQMPSPLTPSDDDRHHRSRTTGGATTPVSQESYGRYVERQNQELQKIAQTKLGASPKNIPLAASKPMSVDSNPSPTNSDLEVANLFRNGGGSVSGGSEASLDDFVQEQRMALESFRQVSSKSSHASSRTLKQPQQPPSVVPSRLAVPDLPGGGVAESSRLKQAPLETTRLQQAPPHGMLKQPPQSSFSSMQPKPPRRCESPSVGNGSVANSISGSQAKAPLQPSRPVRRRSSSSSTKPKPMDSDDEVSLPPPPRKVSRNPFNGSTSNRSSLTQRMKKPAPPLPMTFQKRPSPQKKMSPPPRLVYEEAARSAQHHPQYDQPDPQQKSMIQNNNSLSTKKAPPSVYSYNQNYQEDGSSLSRSIPSAPHLVDLHDSKGNILSPNYSIDHSLSLPSAMTDINSMMIPEMDEPSVYRDTYEDDDEYMEEEVIEYEEEEYTEEEVEEGDVNMNIIRSSLGMNDQSCCLRHPNQLICEYSPSFRFDLVNTCKVCSSERQAGSSQSTSSLGASKEMAKVIGDIQQLQSNKSQWRRKTNLMYYGDSSYQSSTRTDVVNNTDGNNKKDANLVVPLLESDWKNQVIRRVDQIQSWEKVTALKYNPRSARFFRMLKMGVPMGAVQIECELEGCDPAILQFDPERTVTEQLEEHCPNDPDTQANLILKFDQGSLLEDCTAAEVVDVITKAFETEYTRTEEKKARKRKRQPNVPPTLRELDFLPQATSEENIRQLEQEKARADDASKRRRIEEEARVRAEEELESARQAEKAAREQVEEDAEEIIILTQAQMLMREKADDASRRRRAEMDARLKVEEQMQMMKEAESQRRQEQEVMANEVQRLRKAEVEARLKAQDSSVRRRAEMEERLKAEEELRQLRETGIARNEDVQQTAEELTRLREAEATARKKAVDSSIRRRAEVDARLKAEEELQRMKDLDLKRKTDLERNDREIKQLKEAEENARKKAEDSSIRRREEVEARIKAEDELKKLANLESRAQKELGDLASELKRLQKAESEAREKAVVAIQSRREETDTRKKLEDELEEIKRTEAESKEAAEKNAKKLKKERSALKDLKKEHDRRLQELDTAKKEAEERAQRLEEEKASMESKLKSEASEHSASIRARETEALRRHEAEEATQMMIAEQAKHLQEEIQKRAGAEERALALEQEKESVEKQLAFQEGARRAIEVEVAQLKAKEQDRIQAVKRAQKKLESVEKEKTAVAQKLKLEVETRQIAEGEVAKLKAFQTKRESEGQQREEQAVATAQRQFELERLRLQAELKKEEQARLEADFARQAAEEEVRRKGVQELKSRSEATESLKREKDARLKVESEAKRLKNEAKMAREMIAVSEAAEEEIRERLEKEIKAKLEVETKLKDEAKARKYAESNAELLKASVAEESANRLKADEESGREPRVGVESDDQSGPKSPYPDSLPYLSSHSETSWDEMEVVDSASEATEDEMELVSDEEHEVIEEEIVMVEEIVDDDADFDDLQASRVAQEESVEGDGSSSPSLSVESTKPLSDARYRQQLIDAEFDRIIRDAEEHELEEKIEPEAVEALRIASNILPYRKKYYNSSEDRFIFYPSIRRLLIEYTLIEKAEQYYYEEDDEFPIEYSAALRAIACESTGDDDSEDEEMEQFGVDILFQGAAMAELVSPSEDAEFEIVADVSDVSDDEEMAEDSPSPLSRQEEEANNSEPPRPSRPSPVFKKIKAWKNPFE
ncbi:unnamed protein product [Cylindrotheca closterium]|uniref:Uncharacterized protein n=1 Tax=Cylindrotheca closterium TaxID=2856 RepID=A0AAD2CNI2_9STRA|nr:unnamed protein product [Cylindrotheca closterium]